MVSWKLRYEDKTTPEVCSLALNDVFVLLHIFWTLFQVRSFVLETRAWTPHTFSLVFTISWLFIVYFIEITYKPYNICNKIISLSPLVFGEFARAFCKKKKQITEVKTTGKIQWGHSIAIGKSGLRFFRISRPRNPFSR